MAEASQKRKSNEALLKHNPFCIFCGGTEPATTIEHCPPRMMFRGKRRPHELVFPSCDRCNSGTRRSDLVASLLGRVYPDGTDIDQADFGKVLKGVANNVPGLLEEMWQSDAEQHLAEGSIPMPPTGGSLLRANGPILKSHILTFGGKLGLALHFELHKRPVPLTGGVQSIWFSNVQAAKGEIPRDLLAILPTPRTMQQGKQHVADQFQYSWVTTEEREHSLFYAVFRQSFAIAAVTAHDRTKFLDKWRDKYRVLAPSEIRDPPLPPKT
jgi:hypothetical protein